MQRLRNVLADVLVGIVVLIVVAWLLRGVLSLVVWGVSVILLLIVVGFVLHIASKLRGGRR